MNNKKWLLISIVLCLVFFTTNSKVYSGDPFWLESLRGLSEVCVVIESLPSAIEGKGLTREQIQTAVELKLRLAGIKVIPKEKILSIPGSPCFDVTISAATRRSSPAAGLIIFSASFELLEAVNLNRDPKIKRPA